FEIASPVGAFYLFLKIPKNQNQDDKVFALELAKNAKVGLTPGSAFGQDGAGYVRLSYAASLEDLKEAVNRLNNYFLAYIEIFLLHYFKKLNVNFSYRGERNDDI